MNILICDDDPAFCEKVQKYAASFFTARNIPVKCSLCTSAAEVLDGPDPSVYQLAFLDVDLAAGSGIELGRTLKQQNPRVLLVYISAYLEFAPQGYTVSAFRYILKDDIRQMLPLCLEDIYAELCRAVQKAEGPDSGDQAGNPPYPLRPDLFPGEQGAAGAGLWRDPL